MTDEQGAAGYDFAVVQVVDPAQPDRRPPAIQAAYAPSLDIKPGQAVVFKARTFGTTEGDETWNFGDGDRRRAQQVCAPAPPPLTSPRAAA